MVTVFGFSFSLPSELDFLNPRIVSFVLTSLAWLLIAFLVYFTLTYILRAFTRRLPGDVEDILLAIFRRPLIILIMSFGVVDAFEILPLPDPVIQFSKKVFTTVLILVVLSLAWRLIRDVIVYYGRSWAKRTESKVDDNLIAVLNLFGPLMIIVIGILLILQLWGYNITSVLVGAGVVGLVLGLALQDSLSNLFSGMSMVVEASFQVGDLLVLPDGSVCEVQELGLRSTQLYSLDQHSTVHMPNNLIANNQIINITKPTVERRSTIDLTVSAGVDLAQVEEQVEQIAGGQPGVLMDDLEKKIALVENRLIDLKEEVKSATNNEPLYRRLFNEIPSFEMAITKLRLERIMNENLHIFHEQISQLSVEIRAREKGGLGKEERQELLLKFVAPADRTCQALVKSAEAWSQAPDGWASQDELNYVRAIWERRNERLSERWKDLKDSVVQPDEREELRLDDKTMQLVQWLTTSYKILPEAWKNPRVSFKSFDGDTALMQLSFYIDNIRLEHDLRLQRVTTDIAREIRQRGLN